MGCGGSKDKKNKQKNQELFNRMDSISNFRSFYKNDRFSKCLDSSSSTMLSVFAFHSDFY